MPYSVDLRERVLGAVDAGMSKLHAHQTFRVSRSTIDDWLQLRQDTGSLAAKTHYRRGLPPKIHDLVAFERFAQQHTGATLQQMAQAWQGETGQAVSNVTIGKALRRLGWTRKKRVGATKSAVPMSAPSS